MDTLERKTSMFRMGSLPVAAFLMEDRAMMEFEEFKEKTVEELEKITKGKKAEIREVLKNNGVRRHGAILYSPQETAFPTVYLEGHYERYRQGESFPEVIREIKKEFDSHRPPDNLPALSGFTCWSLVKEKLDIKVVNYKANQELLEALPHRRFLDLAETYCYMQELGGGSRGTVLIDKSHLQMWGITQEELKECAHMCHKKRRAAWVKSLEEAVLWAAGQLLPEMEECLEGNPAKMYVAANAGSVSGASILLYPECFRGLAERLQKDLYILPSSVFEVLALPAGWEEPEELAGMVWDVNRYEVPVEDRLSDSVYLYSRDSGEITLAWEWKEGQQGKGVARE